VLYTLSKGSVYEGDRILKEGFLEDKDIFSSFINNVGTYSKNEILKMFRGLSEKDKEMIGLSYPHGLVNFFKTLAIDLIKKSTASVSGFFDVPLIKTVQGMDYIKSFLLLLDGLEEKEDVGKDELFVLIAMAGFISL